MAGELCILEYVSDGMEGGDDSQISVNKLFEEYVYAYVQYANWMLSLVYKNMLLQEQEKEALRY